MPDAWAVEDRNESPSDLHAAWPAVALAPERRRVALCRPTRPAVVLGSTQRHDVVDLDAARSAGIDVVRRRSGGGAVLVLPDDPVWVDVWVPAGDPLWRADVTGAFGWLGATWASAAERLGLTGVAVQDSGPGACTRWSSLVCFGGVGAGEVTVAGRKLVGLSQRRNRSGAWFHGACVLRWDPVPLLDVLALSAADRSTVAGELATAAVGVVDALGDDRDRSAPGAPPDGADVWSAIVDALPD